MKKILIPTVILALILAGFAYWYFFFHGPGSIITPSVTGGNNSGGGFTPFGRIGGNSGTSTSNNGNQNATTTPIVQVKISTLRRLSDTPIGGYAASTTASTTLVRWIDRGKGNVYELSENSTNVVTLSNTILPRVFESVWNKTMGAFIGVTLQAGANTSSLLYAQILPASTSTVSIAPYELRGRDLPDGIIAYAASPKRDKIFLLINESGKGVGYVANFDGKSMVKIFDTPLTKVNVDWPEENTIAITTKGSADIDGYLYFVNPKTGIWKKVLGPLPGLSSKVSHDAKNVIFSASVSSGGAVTGILNVAKNSSTDAVVRTLADKCAWGNFFKEVVYCAVPAQPSTDKIPDDWYKGTVLFIDKIWQINASTTEVHLVSSIVDQSDRVIDAFNLGLDDKDDYLFFMNKNDLSFWSFDLVAAH